MTSSDKSSHLLGGKSRVAAIETAFKVGDRVGQADGDTAVQIEVISIYDRSYLTAKVIALGNFFSSERIKQNEHGTGSSGFILDEVLLLRGRVASGIDEWIITKPNDRPWHTLACRDGKKTFEHYR